MVQSTHVCNVKLPSLPTVLEGHIIPDLAVALLVGRHILCKAGCLVLFTNTACYLMYNGKVILAGTNDPSTDLWTFPITLKAIKCSEDQKGLRITPEISLPQACPCITHAPGPPLALPTIDSTHHLLIELATFTHSPVCKPKQAPSNLCTSQCPTQDIFPLESCTKGLPQKVPQSQ
jgi:hypothetical protein